MVEVAFVAISKSSLHTADVAERRFWNFHHFIKSLVFFGDFELLGALAAGFLHIILVNFF